jgi:hypothetical protein
MLRRWGSASTTFTVGPAGAASLIYASAAKVAATRETATAGPTVFGDFMGLLCCPRTARSLDAMASFNVETAACSADPVDPQDRTQPAKLEIPFGHAFDKRVVLLRKSAVRVRPVGPGREAHRVTAAALEVHKQHARNAWW